MERRSVLRRVRLTSVTVVFGTSWMLYKGAGTQAAACTAPETCCAQSSGLCLIQGHPPAPDYVDCGDIKPGRCCGPSNPCCF